MIAFRELYCKQIKRPLSVRVSGITRADGMTLFSFDLVFLKKLIFSGVSLSICPIYTT